MLACQNTLDFILISDNHLSFALNTLKLAGIFIGGVATVLATLKETKTPDKLHLSRQGIWILGLGVVGVLIAFGAQAIDWKVSLRKELGEAAKNHQLLLAIQRSVTRLEQISLDVRESMDSSEPEVRMYGEALKTRLESIDDQPDPVGKEIEGLKVTSRTLDPWPRNNVIKIPVHSEALPALGRDEEAETLLGVTEPRIAIYRKDRAIDPQSYLKVFPDPPTPDIVLDAKGGNLEGMIVPIREFGSDEVQSLALTLSRRDMDIPPESWHAALGFESMADLNGAQAIVVLPLSSRSERLWSVHPPTITLSINHHKTQIDKWTVVHGAGRTAYVYTFPTNFISVE